MYKPASKRSHVQTRQRRSALFIILLLGCLLLLSACRDNNITGSQAHTLSTHKLTSPILINGSLLQQGQDQIQSFQLWIGLMQQFHGDASKYQQEYTDAQKALASSSTASAY